MKRQGQRNVHTAYAERTAGVTDISKVRIRTYLLWVPFFGVENPYWILWIPRQMVIPGLQAGNQCMQINKDMHTTSVLHVRIEWRDREGEREREREHLSWSMCLFTDQNPFNNQWWVINQCKYTILIKQLYSNLRRLGQSLKMYYQCTILFSFVNKQINRIYRFDKCTFASIIFPVAPTTIIVISMAGWYKRE